VRGGALAGAGALLAVGVFETALCVPNAMQLGLFRALHVIAIGVSLTAAMAAIAAVVVGAGCALPRCALAMAGGRAAAETWPGWFADRSVRTVPGPHGGAWVHAVCSGAAVFVLGATWTIALLATKFRTPTLIGLVGAIGMLFWIAAGAACGLAVVAAARVHTAQRAGAPPSWRARFAGPRAALCIWMGLGWLGIFWATMNSVPFAIAFPHRLAASASLFGLALLGMSAAAPRWSRHLRRARTGLVATAGGLAILSVATLGWLSDNDDARRSVLQSPLLTLFGDTVRRISDVDRDGYSALLGGGDCAPFDASVNPGARDVPNDGIDQNCRGGDYVPRPRPVTASVPLPEELVRKDWSILLVTIDAFRYDHVGFAGYPRATTPTVDALAKRGAWFDAAYSTSYRTYYVMPSLLTSMFHEELPLGPPLKPRMPSTVALSVTTIAEVLAAAGYRTAMFTAFVYFDGWGIEQGFDTFVNEQEFVDPPRHAAERLTDRALVWLEALPDEQPWFMWLHLFEPHYPYERHGYEFGPGELNAYDEEIRYADAQLARVIEWIDASPARRDRTMIIVTSDHGEAFGEHGMTRHGAGTLWQVLIRVPLVIVVPGAEPQRLASPVSLIDVAPTIAAVAGVTRPESWNGRPLIGEITAGTEDSHRIVFATDPAGKRYAAITTGWKLLRDERRNIYQLVDLRLDPDEQLDASAAQPEIRATLDAALVGWRERMLDAEVVPIDTSSPK
jgi:hypothetical protein